MRLSLVTICNYFWLLFLRMKAQLQQKKGLNRRNFILMEDRIFVEDKSQNYNSKYEIGLEKLGNKLHYHAESNRQYKIGAMIIGSVYLTLFGFYIAGRMKGGEIMIMSVMMAILLAILLLRPYKDDIFLVGGQTNLAFFRTKPSEKEVLEFIDTIKATQKNYLKQKYTAFDNYTHPEEFFARIGWLKSENIITNEEFEDYKNSFELLNLLK